MLTLVQQSPSGGNMESIKDPKELLQVLFVEIQIGQAERGFLAKSTALARFIKKSVIFPCCHASLGASTGIQVKSDTPHQTVKTLGIFTWWDLLCYILNNRF